MEDEPTVPLPEAARILGVHYMTAYRRVRTGRLPATFDGLTWNVPVAALTATTERPTRATSAARRREELRRRMLAGDESGAWWVLEDALASGVPSKRALLEMVAPALADVGDEWAQGTLTVADEHCATAIASRLVARLGPTLRPRGRSRGAIIVGAIEGDRHGLVVSIAADVLRGDGIDVIELGADVPTESFIEVGRATARLAAVGIAATADLEDDRLVTTARTVREALGITVIMGGAAARKVAPPADEGIVRTTTIDELVAASRAALELVGS